MTENTPLTGPPRSPQRWSVSVDVDAASHSDARDRLEQLLERVEGLAAELGLGDITITGATPAADWTTDLFDAQACRVCGCTDADCTGCIERTGGPCAWAESDLCTACAERVGIEVTIRDLLTGEVTESCDLENDYMLIVAGDRYLWNTQSYPNGTHILTVKRGS